MLIEILVGLHIPAVVVVVVVDGQDMPPLTKIGL
jgi:hypothetical protein